MFITTSQDLANRAAARWKEAYLRCGVWLKIASGSSREIHERLVALGPSPSPEAVAAVIGNEGWVKNWCDQCLELADQTITVGAEIHDESPMTTLCFPCFESAIKLFNNHKEKAKC